jgi:hypothetical protein
VGLSLWEAAHGPAEAMAVGANSGHGAFKDHKGITETHAEHAKNMHDEGDDPYEGLTTKEIAALKAQMGDGPIIDKPYDEMTTKEKLYMTFEDPSLNVAAGVISFVITCMILTSTACFIAETMPELAYEEEVSATCEIPPCGVSEETWGSIELVCILGFTLDFVVKLSCTPVLKLFVSDPMNWIDFIAIVPFYIEIAATAAGVNVNFLKRLRVIRVARLARLLRLLKNSPAGNMTTVIGTIVSSSVAALAIPIYFVFLAVIVYASLMYYAERGTPVTCYGPGMGGDPDELWMATYGTGGYCDPDAPEKLKAIHPTASYYCDPYDGTHVHSHLVKESGVGNQMEHHGTDCCYCKPNGSYEDSNKFESIPDGLWWCVVTFTTVGYGDKFPVTWIGRFVAIMMMVTGVFFMAMPLTIVGTAFNAAWEGIQESEKKKEQAPYIGTASAAELNLLHKYYTFAQSAVALESVVIGVADEKERLQQRKEILELMVPLRKSHGSFRSALCSHMGIYKIPDELRKKVGLEPEDDKAPASTSDDAED